MEYLVMYLVAGILYTGYRYAVDWDDFVWVLKNRTLRCTVCVITFAYVIVTAVWPVFYVSNVVNSIKDRIKK